MHRQVCVSKDFLLSLYENDCDGVQFFWLKDPTKPENY